MLIYNVPVAALGRYQNKTVVVRSDDARKLAEAFSAVPREKLSSLQVLSLDCDADVLLHLPESEAIDLVLSVPTADFAKLYRFAELFQRHTVRVTVPAVPGMTKAVKIAQALKFGVKLAIGRPDAVVVDELIALAEYYLRGSTVNSPIEPFHSLFLSFYSGEPTSLWSLQEEDPTVDRYVTDEGAMAFSKRLVSLGIPENQFKDFLEQHMSAFLAADECAGCEFFARCKCFFKLPYRDYQCDHVRRVFALLRDAAEELQQDEERFAEVKSRDNSHHDADPATLPKSDQSDAALCVPAIDAAKQRTLSSFSMQRLNYRTEEFTRHSWTNDEAQVVWEPRIRRVCTCLNELEWRSILEGIRACALTSVAPNDFGSLAAKLSTYGLSINSLDKVSAREAYTISLKRPQEGEPFHHWCVIGRESDIQLFESAYFSHDDKEIGRLLGYPACCIDFFNRVWVDEGFIDTTWPMAQNTAGKRIISPTHLGITEGSNCNQLLRWLGLRIAFHLPCSFDCRPTVELTQKLAEVAKSAGFHQEMDWLDEMMNWPVEWTALNGFLEITTPVGTISTVTDVTTMTYRVSYNGAGHAKATERMMSLPTDPVDEPFGDLEWYYGDNGFSSREGMDLFHEPIVNLAEETLIQASGNVLDLGCGNGLLVKKICQANTSLVPWGVDISDDNIAHARLFSPQFVDNFAVSNIFDDCSVWSKGREFELVVLALVRLTEVNEEQAEELLRRIRKHAKDLLVYAYEGDGSLDELARKTGVILPDKRSGDTVAMVDLEKL